MAIGGEEQGTPVPRALAVLSDALDALVSAVEDGGLDHLDDCELVGFLQGFERVRNRLPLVDHRVIADAERRHLADALCQSSVRQVLTSALRVSKGEAARRVRAAAAVGVRTSALGQPLPPVRVHLAAAQREGAVGPEHVAVVERALSRVDCRGFDPDRVETGERLLAEQARSFELESLRRLAEQVVDAIDPDGTLPRDELNADRRYLHLRPTPDGVFRGEFRLTGAAGVKLRTLLEPLTKVRVADAALVGCPDGVEPPARLLTDVDPRSYGQRMHDGLEELCDRVLAAGDVPAAGGVPTTVLVTITLEDLVERVGYGCAADGTLLSTAEVLRLAEQAEIVPAVLNRSGAVLDLGRTRRIASPSQTLALAARDRGCSFPGCDRPPQWTERHHLVEWVQGGRTDLDNLTLVCRYHHHWFGARGWTCRMNAERVPEWVPPRWVDPEQRPRVNTRVRAATLGRRVVSGRSRRAGPNGLGRSERGSGSAAGPGSVGRAGPGSVVRAEPGSVVRAEPGSVGRAGPGSTGRRVVTKAGLG